MRVFSSFTYHYRIILDDDAEWRKWIQDIDPGWSVESASAVALGMSVASLGVVGYIRAGSRISLITGATIGGAMSLSAWLIRSGRKPRVGRATATGLALLLVTSMGPKAYETKSLYPGGAIAIASIINAAQHVTAMIMYNQ